MKTNSNGRQPKNVNSRVKLRGNLECGSAQPSLFSILFSQPLISTGSLSCYVLTIFFHLLFFGELFLVPLSLHHNQPGSLYDLHHHNSNFLHTSSNRSFFSRIILSIVICYFHEVKLFFSNKRIVCFSL